MPTSGLTWAGMLLTGTLGCQRRQKAAPERLPEVDLSLVHLRSLHIAAVAPFSGTFALALLAKLWWILGPADRPCWTTADFWTLLAGKSRKCKVRHLATMTTAPSNIVYAGRGSSGHHRDSCIPTITIITCFLQTPNICIDNKNTADVLFMICKLEKLSLCLHFHMRAHGRH